MNDQLEPLRPRAERCPEPECTDENQCWRCDYEESQHATATAIANGYCPDCGRGDAGPTADQYEQQRQRADAAEASLAALKRAHVAMAEQAGREQAALGRVQAYLDRLDEFTDLTASRPDRSLYQSLATDLRKALNGQESTS
ncbi:hypothetical protein AB0M92_18895 [Streptomyces sp. NPDC051582]|uniref:hypothetical protein n=1 Tax=Streptomyces sp. NPDC051582 TaxID=3155167 RepID=UPI0034375857